MRITRSKVKSIKRKYIKTVLIIFIIIIPSLAYLSSKIIFNTVYNKPDIKAIDQSKNLGTLYSGGPVGNNAFNYIFELSGKKIYRIESKKFHNFEDAEKFVNKIKNKKYSPFIIKKSGYLVYFGYFETKENAEKIMDKLKAVKLECNINEINFNSISISYGENDKKFIEIVKDSDNLMNRIFEEKCKISFEIIFKDNKPSKDEISTLMNAESKLTENLIIMMNISVSTNIAIFKENYIEALKAYKDNNLAQDSFSYFDIQKSMSYQLEAYDKLIQSLSI